MLGVDAADLKPLFDHLFSWRDVALNCNPVYFRAKFEKWIIKTHIAAQQRLRAKHLHTGARMSSSTPCMQLPSSTTALLP